MAAPALAPHTLGSTRRKTEYASLLSLTMLLSMNLQRARAGIEQSSARDPTLLVGVVRPSPPLPLAGTPRTW